MIKEPKSYIKRYEEWAEKQGIFVNYFNAPTMTRSELKQYYRNVIKHNKKEIERSKKRIKDIDTADDKQIRSWSTFPSF